MTGVLCRLRNPPSTHHTMGNYGLGEPGLGTVIILSGIFINRDTTYTPTTSWFRWRPKPEGVFIDDVDNNEKGLQPLPHRSRSRHSRSPSPSPFKTSTWRQRELQFPGFSITVQTPNTAVFRDTLPSRILRKFPFIMEVVYWGMIYSVYQAARGQLARHRTDQTVVDSRHHALQVVWLEQHMHFFWEKSIQQFVMQFPNLMWWLIRVYSYVHIPATITFLVSLYYYSISRNRSVPVWQESLVAASLYESRRRALSLCNLLSFVVFALWPCMPPRLLDNDAANNGIHDGSPHFGFIDSVHAAKTGAVSFWNKRKFTNQLAAMPSMHFGYSLLIGLTIMMLPLPYDQQARSSRSPSRRLRLPLGCCIRIPRSVSPLRLFLLIVGFSYPFTILVAIISTANHFILDAIAGAAIVLLAFKINYVMLNLRVFEDYFFWIMRTYKPVPDETMDEFERGRSEILLGSPSTCSSRSTSGRVSPD